MLLTDEMRADFVRVFPGRPASLLRYIDGCLSHPGMLATCLYRVQTRFFRRRARRRARMLRVLNNALTGADIAPGCEMAEGLILRHPTGVVIGSGVSIGKNCVIMQNVTIGERDASGSPPHYYPTIGAGVVVGAGAVILGHVSVGDGAVIGANAVVLADVPSEATVVGIPAKLVRRSEKQRSTAGTARK